MVAERFGTDASHGRQMLLSLFCGHGLDVPENKGQNAPKQNRAIRLKGRCTHLYRSFPRRFHWISSVYLTEPLNDLRAAIAHVKAILERTTLELRNPKLNMVESFKKQNMV